MIIGEYLVASVYSILTKTWRKQMTLHSSGYISVHLRADPGNGPCQQKVLAEYNNNNNSIHKWQKIWWLPQEIPKKKKEIMKAFFFYIYIYIIYIWVGTQNGQIAPFLESASLKERKRKSGSSDEKKTAYPQTCPCKCNNFYLHWTLHSNWSWVVWYAHLHIIVIFQRCIPLCMYLGMPHFAVLVCVCIFLQH